MEAEGGQPEEPNAESVLRWLSANIIYPAPKDCPMPISINIDKVIFTGNSANWSQIMGDHFDKIGAGAAIVNRSTLTGSLNRVHYPADDAVVQALQVVAKFIEDSGNQGAAENFDALSEELGKPQPKKALLQSYWNGILLALPGLAEIATIADSVAKLFK
jgi:hypothetical protein